MLEIANLSHTYANGTVALDDVSLSIPRGMFGLLGPNGAGKSTLMRTVATLQEPTAGTIKFGDIDVLAEPERLRKTLGYLPQDFGVYPRVSAYAMLDQLAVLKGITGKAERKSVVETLLNQTNLWAVRDKAIAGFSGGMRQRFGIAQALIGNPELIIVDEPTAGLDPEERNRFLNLLAGIGDNVVVILSTHIVDDVADLCPRMAVLANGRAAARGQARRPHRLDPRQGVEEGHQARRARAISSQPRGDFDAAVRRQHDRPRPVGYPAQGVRTGRGRARGCLFLDPLVAPPRSLSGSMSMFLGITRFEIRYQLKNPVFWVAIAIFFLIGFGLTASENVSIGTPGGVHENAPAAIAVAMAVFTVFYIFVVTAFVANAIVRDDSTGFGPIVRSTSVTKTQLVLGRFIGGLIIAWLGYLALPLGMAAGVAMPWVDPETVGPQKLAYYAWNYAIFGLPNILLLCAILFALATALRSMMAAYIGVTALVMGYLVTSGVVGQKIEYRDTLARWEPLGNGALGQAIRYWTQNDMNTRLVDLTGTLLFNRIYAIVLALLFLGLAVWRFSMTERAPSKRKLRRLAKQDARAAKAAAVAPALDGGEVVARERTPSRGVQFMTRLRVEVRQVLTSPGLIVLALLGVGLTAANLWFGRSVYGTTDHPTASSVITTVRGGFALFLLIIAVFYGGELVWRERDRKFNEIIDSTPVQAWIMTIPKILALFVVLLIINLVAMATGLFYQLVQGAREFGISQYLIWFIVPTAIYMLQIAVLAVLVQVLSPNKYVGWGVMFVWFVGMIFLNNMGYSNPLYNYPDGPSVPLSDFVGAGSFWKGAWWFHLYWMCFAIILAVIAHLLWPRGTDLGLGVRLRRMMRRLEAVPLTIAGVALLGMAATGVYNYHNIKQLNRYETADDAEKFSADYEKKYLKFEKLPQPAITKVTLDVQLYPKERRLLAAGHYDLRNNSGVPIRDLHLRDGDRDIQWLKLDIPGARLVSDDKKFGYRIYRFDTPLAPGATTSLTFTSQLWHRGFKAFQPDTDLIENGTFVNNFAFTPIIGMSRQGLLSDRAKRRRQGLPPELRPAKLEDMSATRKNYIGSDWVDVRHYADDGRRPDADRAGQPRLGRDEGGRRTAHFLSRRADPQFLLDAIGATTRSRPASTTASAVGLL